MATLAKAEVDEIRRLLELFPVATLRDQFPDRGDKEEVADAVAKRGEHHRIAEFVARNFSQCRQHVYVLGKSQLGITLPIAFGGVDELIKDPAGRTIYLSEVEYTVYVKDPYDAVHAKFLWPIRVEERGDQRVVSFVVLERDPKPIANRAVITAVRHLDEKTVVRALGDLGFAYIDINKGVKDLWANAFMDAFMIKFKRPFSTATEKMDEELGIRSHNPQLFEDVMKLPLFDSLFRIHPSKGSTVSSFHVNPTTGRISFPIYTEVAGDCDDLVRKILEANS